MDATPSLAGFISFLRNFAGITAEYLPDDSQYIQFAYDVASGSVNESLGLIPGLDYAMAIYNLGTDTIINYAQDTTAPFETDANGKTFGFFAAMRKSFGVNNFVAGVMTGAGDAGTAGTIAISDAMQQLSLSDLQNLKTPFGRNYLAIAQKYGTPWGIS